MPSLPALEGVKPSPSQPSGDGVPVASDQATAPPPRYPPRALSMRTVMRSKQRQIALAKSRQRHWAYPPDPIDLSKSAILNSASNNQDRSRSAQISEKKAMGKKGDITPPNSDTATPGPNSCFLCFSKGADQYAVVVNLVWPGRFESMPVKTKKKKSKARVATAERKEYMAKRFIKEGTEAKVMQAIQDAIYQQTGRWKRWLWCYEIRLAEEVNFHFDDVANSGRAAVQIARLDVHEIRQRAQKAMDNAPSQVDYEYGTACASSTDHNEDCCVGQELGLPCIHDRLFEASTRLQGYRRRHWLKECLQKPERAKGRQFLERGLLQKSFVYRDGEATTLPADAQSLADAGEMRGVYVTLGWNVSRMLFHVRAGCIYTAVGLAVVWLGCVLWAGHKGDWSTALAFGQLLAASLALMLHHA